VIHKLKGKIKSVARNCAAAARSVSPAERRKRAAYTAQRDEVETFLASIPAHDPILKGGNVLVDGTWDNPNYWLRFGLIRSALGLQSSTLTGIVGQYRSRYCRRSFKNFGFDNVVEYTPKQSAGFLRQAREMLESVKTPDDFLALRLPGGLPSDFLYDGILKRQRAACVDIHAPSLADHLAEQLHAISWAQRILNSQKYELLIISHPINLFYAALTWTALSQNIPVFIPFGNYGVPRFVKMRTAADIRNMVDRPMPQNMESLSPERAAEFESVGAACLQRRFAGQTDDLGAIYAFQKRKGYITRAEIQKQFGWDPARPIVAFYASNWFDFPHGLGMSHFRDFLDWLQITVQAAEKNTRVNWLFKAHPCDEWYGGITLSDLMPSLGSNNHVRIVPKDWNNTALMNSVDALITYHGTAGLEYAASGKPVLLADRGWYHDLGFARCCSSRADYIQSLDTDWWSKFDTRDAARRARTFCGYYLGRAAWQGDFLLQDDSTQDAIYPKVIPLFKQTQVWKREIETLRRWFLSPAPHYHTFKVQEAGSIPC